MFQQLSFLLLVSTAIATNACDQLDIYGSTSVQNIKPSAGRVFFTQTGGSTCLDVYDCYERIGYMKSPKFVDNFFIGEDGNIYVGMGWQSKNYRYDGYHNDLSIAFIGDFTDRPLTKNMVEAALGLIECGLDEDYIQFFYSVYSSSDLECGNNEVLPNSIDEALETFPRYYAGGPLVNC